IPGAASCIRRACRRSARRPGRAARLVATAREAAGVASISADARPDGRRRWRGATTTTGPGWPVARPKRPPGHGPWRIAAPRPAATASCWRRRHESIRSTAAADARGGRHRPVSGLFPAVGSGFGWRQHAAPDLVEFDRFEQRLEVAFAEALVALALDDLEEDRADHRPGEDLQEQAAVGAAVEQDAVGRETGAILAVVRQARIEQLVVGVGRIEELDAGRAQLLDGGEYVAGRQGDVLDAFALVHLQVFLDLAAHIGALFVDRDPDLAAWRGHGLRPDAAHLAFDVEVADFAELEQAFVEAGPFVHSSPVDVVGEVVDSDQAGAERC